MRRANATGLVLAGVDLKTAQKRLGHSDPRLPIGLYAQAATDANKAAAEAPAPTFQIPRGMLAGSQMRDLSPGDFGKVPD